MNRPYIICHMVTSIDGKVTGEFLYKPECEKATDIYYEINRNLKCNGFICGRVTMEGSFTNCWYPDISAYQEEEIVDFIPENLSGFYAVSFDTNGKLGWKDAFIKDEDEGYDKAQIIEVLSENVNKKYLGYLKSKNIPFIFAGKEKIDVNKALKKLKELFNIDMLLLEGGSILNGAFLKADAVDEISLVTAPIVADKCDKPLFMDSEIKDFELVKCSNLNGILISNYLKKGARADNNTVKIKWENPLKLDDAIDNELSDNQGLYYITRVFGKKETTLYLGIATKNNTIRHRLKGHKSWLKYYRGTINVRIGNIIYPYTNIDEVIDHAESAILYEQKNLFLENTAKIQSYKYNNVYKIENTGNIFQLKKFIDMNDQE